ncbi:MAG: type II toxin-antitoxin system RelE/ParE family toxin [Microbacteriaceae bacterium]
MTPRRVVTTRRADEDIDSAIAYYVDSGARDAALGFIDALENAKALLGEHSSIGSPRFAIETSISELRGLSLQRFPYIIVYTDDSDAIRVHRVLHTSRDIPAELIEP